jgi:hypothetical protein
MALTAVDKGSVNITFNPGGVISGRVVELKWLATDNVAQLASVAAPSVPTAQGVILACPGATYNEEYAQYLAGLLSRYAQNAFVAHKTTENGTTFYAEILRSIAPPIAQVYAGNRGTL